MLMKQPWTSSSRALQDCRTRCTMSKSRALSRRALRRILQGDECCRTRMLCIVCVHVCKSRFLQCAMGMSYIRTWHMIEVRVHCLWAFCACTCCVVCVCVYVRTVYVHWYRTDRLLYVHTYIFVDKVLWATCLPTCTVPRGYLVPGPRKDWLPATPHWLKL